MRTRQEEWNMQKFQGTADMILNHELIEQKAHDIGQWLQDAVGDVADCDPWSEEWKKRIKKAKKDGVTDIKGWYADELYNDVDTLQDLCGDRIHDAANQVAGTHKNPEFDLHFVAIAEKMKERAHTALVKALDKLIARHNG